MENIDTVFEIFNSNLNDPDTYIYLQAIKGLANCSFHKPELVIDKLGHEFGHLDDTKYPGEKGIEVRTKIGEALVQVTKILGEMTPAHKNKLLNPFLAQLSHPDPLIRSSSLSNLGEVCKNLKFSLGEIILFTKFLAHYMKSYNLTRLLKYVGLVFMSLSSFWRDLAMMLW